VSLASALIAKVERGVHVKLRARNEILDRHPENPATNTHTRPVGVGWDSHFIETIKIAPHA